MDPHAQWQRDPEAWKDDIQRDLEDQIEEAKSHAERRRDYLAFLERLQIYRLRQEQGEEPLPEDFAAPAEEEEKADSDLLEPSKDDVEDPWESEKHPKWHDYYMMVLVCEEGVWVPLGFQHKGERLLMHAVEKFPGWSAEDDKT